MTTGGNAQTAAQPQAYLNWTDQNHPGHPTKIKAIDERLESNGKIVRGNPSVLGTPAVLRKVQEIFTDPRVNPFHQLVIICQLAIPKQSLVELREKAGDLKKLLTESAKAVDTITFKQYGPVVLVSILNLSLPQIQSLLSSLASLSDADYNDLEKEIGHVRTLGLETKNTKKLTKAHTTKVNALVRQLDQAPSNGQALAAAPQRPGGSNGTNNTSATGNNANNNTTNNSNNNSGGTTAAAPIIVDPPVPVYNDFQVIGKAWSFFVRFWHEAIRTNGNQVQVRVGFFKDPPDDVEVPVVTCGELFALMAEPHNAMKKFKQVKGIANLESQHQEQFAAYIMGSDVLGPALNSEDFRALRHKIVNSEAQAAANEFKLTPDQKIQIQLKFGTIYEERIIKVFSTAPFEWTPSLQEKAVKQLLQMLAPLSTTAPSDNPVSDGAMKEAQVRTDLITNFQKIIQNLYVGTYEDGIHVLPGGRLSRLLGLAREAFVVDTGRALPNRSRGIEARLIRDYNLDSIMADNISVDINWFFVLIEMRAGLLGDKRLGWFDKYVGMLNPESWISGQALQNVLHDVLIGDFIFYLFALAFDLEKFVNEAPDIVHLRDNYLEVLRGTAFRLEQTLNAQPGRVRDAYVTAVDRSSGLSTPVSTSLIVDRLFSLREKHLTFERFDLGEVFKHGNRSSAGADEIRNCFSRLYLSPQLRYGITPAAQAQPQPTRVSNNHNNNNNAQPRAPAVRQREDPPRTNAVCKFHDCTKYPDATGYKGSGHSTEKCHTGAENIYFKPGYHSKFKTWGWVGDLERTNEARRGAGQAPFTSEEELYKQKNACLKEFSNKKRR